MNHTIEHPFAPFVRILGKGKTGSRSLSQSEAKEAKEAKEAMTMILNNEVEDIQLGAFLMLLRVKEESPAELAGFANAVREAITPPQSLTADLDWPSYAGKKRQPPWYILSALLLAENGIKVLMHGAKGHTAGRLYSEDVFNSLGLPVASNWQQAQQQLAGQCLSFMPLGAFCPRLQTIIDYRNHFGLRSPVHSLARLINPAGADYSAQSIFHPAYGESHQHAALALQQPHAVVFKGEGGEIERKPEATCTVKQVFHGTTTEDIWPKLLEGRQQHHETISAMDIAKLWRATSNDSYGELAVISTTAIMLKLLGKADDQKQAMNLAHTLWSERDKMRL